ncbi:hypothetical protein [Virgisporangium aliadipatigenens]|uniref:hypothetical protein n=1 Tax=Virgisporangium aliadipatigenens TaxID=741659 RepID=UPI001EF39DC4|nr:hypothetical protein [Virgisporangium aliadipatigenens]
MQRPKKEHALVLWWSSQRALVQHAALSGLMAAFDGCWSATFAYDAGVGEFVDVTLARVPSGFDFSGPLQMLFEWVEKQGYVRPGHDGDLYGSLSADAWVGTSVELRGFTAGQTVSYTRSWFGDAANDHATRLWPFVRTGGDGSMAALWLDGDRRTRVVHLGSGSGSLLTCVLAENGLDFLRLLAIGYREICWGEEFAAPPRPWGDSGKIVNGPYRDWLCGTFGVTVPETASEIVREPAEAGGPATGDAFCRWVEDHLDPPPVR